MTGAPLRLYLTGTAAPVVAANDASWTLATSTTTQCLMSDIPGTTGRAANSNTTADASAGTQRLLTGVSAAMPAGTVSGPFRAVLRMTQSISPLPSLTPRVVVRLLAANGSLLATLGTFTGTSMPANNTQYARTVTGNLTTTAVPAGARLAVDVGVTKTGAGTYWNATTQPMVTSAAGDLPYADATIGPNGGTFPALRSWVEFDSAPSTPARVVGFHSQIAALPVPARRTSALQAQALLLPPAARRFNQMQVQVLLPVATPRQVHSTHVQVLSRVRLPVKTVDGSHLQRKNAAGQWERMYYVPRP